MALEELVIMEYARRKGIPEDRVKEWLEALRESEGDERVKKLQGLLAILGDGADTLSRLPPEARGPATALITSAAMPLVGDEGARTRLERVVERIAELKAVLSALNDEDSRVRELREELRSIRESLEEVMRAREEQERSALVDALNRIMDRLDQLEDRIAQLESNGGGQAQEPSDPTSVIIRAKEEAEKLRRALEALGFEVKPRGYNIEEVLRELEQLGFEVKRRYITPQELEELKRRIEEETRRKLEVELGIEHKRLEVIGGILKEIIDKIVSNVTQAWLELKKQEALQGLREKLQRRLAEEAASQAAEAAGALEEAVEAAGEAAESGAWEVALVGGEGGEEGG